MKSQIGNTYESPVYNATPVSEDKKLYELSVRMKQLATNVKSGYDDHNAVRVVDNSHELADTVLEFLKVAGWDR